MKSKVVGVMVLTLLMGLGTVPTVDAQAAKVVSDVMEVSDEQKSDDSQYLEEKGKVSDASYAGKIKTMSTPLRKSKSAYSKTIVRIAKGKKVKVYDTIGSWRKISYNGVKGYVPKERVYISTKAPSLKGKSVKEKGETVSEFAQRFKGNKYIWGRTDLNNGTDCSGFVRSVYKAFGYSLPRTSYEQRRAGRKVSSSNIQAGDVVCYNGHVAIYIGGGQIVHASSKKTGIKISPNYRYRKVVSIRRIVK